MRQCGFEALGVDHFLNRGRMKGPAVQLDLTVPWVQDLIFDLVHSKSVVAIFMGPPCGTSSRARNIPICTHLRSRGVPQPRPLRSDSYPCGLPSLRGVALSKVTQANQLYAFSAALCEVAQDYGCLVAVENPAGSIGS